MLEEWGASCARDHGRLAGRTNAVQKMSMIPVLPLLIVCSFGV